MNPLNAASLQNLKDLSGMTKLAKQQALGHEQSEVSDVYSQALAAGLLGGPTEQRSSTTEGPKQEEVSLGLDAEGEKVSLVPTAGKQLTQQEEDRLRLLDSSVHSKLQLNSDLSPEQLSAAQKMVDVSPAKIAKNAQLKHSPETDSAMKPELRSAGPAPMMEILAVDAGRPDIISVE